MRFIVDAQLPRKLSNLLVSKGIDSIHTLDLLNKNLTSDSKIIELCEKQNKVVITKDSDFLESKLIRNKPQKLVLVLTGNIRNDLLINIFDTQIGKIMELLKSSDVIEIGTSSIIAK